MRKIFPSVMAKNQQQLDTLLKKFKGVSTYLHLDVADGKFVANKSLWFPFTLSSKFKYIAHLMVVRPEKWIKKHGKKVEFYIVQAEVVKVGKYILDTKKRRKKVAFALNPETKVSKIKKYLKEVDYVLILTVHPGFYGSMYLNYPLKKIKEIKKLNPKVKVIVDGGINLSTIKEAVKVGADHIVVGSYLAKAGNPKKVMKELEREISEN